MNTYKFKVNGKDYEAKILNDEGSTLEVELNGKTYNVEMDESEKAIPVAIRPAVSSPRPAASSSSTSSSAPAPAGNKAKAIKSPLPGVVLNVKVNPGDQVKKGQIVMVLEAMKMENEIEATADGTVSQINKQKGDSVMEGDTLITLS